MRLARSGDLSELCDEEESDTDFHSSDQIKHKSSLSAERGNDTVRGGGGYLPKQEREAQYKAATERAWLKHREMTRLGAISTQTRSHSRCGDVRSW